MPAVLQAVFVMAFFQQPVFSAEPKTPRLPGRRAQPRYFCCAGRRTAGLSDNFPKGFFDRLSLSNGERFSMRYLAKMPPILRVCCNTSFYATAHLALERFAAPKTLKILPGPALLSAALSA